MDTRNATEVFNKHPIKLGNLRETAPQNPSSNIDILFTNRLLGPRKPTYF